MDNRIIAGLMALVAAGAAVVDRPAKVATETVASASVSDTNPTPTTNQFDPTRIDPVAPSVKSETPDNRDPVTGTDPSGPTIVMVTRANCPPCVQWWNQRNAWEARGWTVLKVDVEGTGIDATPTFRVYEAGTWRTHTGYMTADAAKRLLGRAVKAVKQTVKAPVQAARSIARGTYQGGREWSYPGDIGQHLMGSNHGFSAAQLAGKSKAELERMHSQHHEGMKAQTQPIRRASPCPGGVCPPRSRGLFGWR